MTERTINSTLKTMLMNNESFDYCHLIKFERPSLPDSASGSVSTSRERYTYITDSSIDVSFDDGSTSLAGVSNGAQNYIANKVVRVGSVSEDSEAKATTFNVELDGTSIGAYAEALVNISVVSTGVFDIVVPPEVDLVREGFREGDKVTISGNSSPGDFNIKAFMANNVVRLTQIDVVMLAENAINITMSLASEEIKSILLDKNTANYASFINREVFIWKAFFQEGIIVGEPILIFKGLISNVSFEDTETYIKVSWGMTSHWGDWSQVSGRITSDDFHRALDSNGNPNPISSIKPEYAYDKGFSHAETSVNLLANYTTLVEKQDVTVKKKFFGLISKVKVRNYLSPEVRSTELDFQLQAKSLPVIYGVRPVTGIPVFADTLKDDASSVYVIYALSEGEVASIYDVYIDGNSLICGNKSDFDARSVQNPDNTVPLVCMGRADRGDVLGGAIATSGTPISYYSDETYLYDLGYNLIDQIRYRNYVEPIVTAPVTSSGIKDGETLSLTSPQTIVMDFFSGKEGQKAAQSLVNIAKTSNFKVQSDYWTGTDTAEYWGPNHRLLDTAYVVVKYKIAEGETSIPKLEFIVNGKVIPCYNYDYSYTHYNKADAESSDNFSLGDWVTLKRSDNNATINASVQIIDKWTIYKPDGSADTRFRFSVPPSLDYTDGVPSITKFYISSGIYTWTMVTYNYSETSGSPALELSSTITAVSNSAGALRISYASLASLAIGGDTFDDYPKFSILDSNLAPITNEKFSDSIIGGVTTATDVTTELNYSTNNVFATGLVGNKICSRNTIKLSSSASSVNDYYIDHDITVIKTDITGKQVTQTKRIVAYDGASKIATINGLWDTIPTISNTYNISQAYSDHRTSTNFAMVALEYCTSKSYGRGLNLSSDLYLPSWLESARSCDIHSDVTVRITNAGSSIAVGDIYNLVNSASKTIWQGTVSSVDTSTVPGTSTKFVTFTNVIGKLSNLWNSWKVFKQGDLVYYNNRLYKVATGYAAGGSAPEHTSGTTGNLEFLGTTTISKISGTGPSTEGIFTSGNPVQGIKSDRLSSGYSLYDSDGIDYWKYVGWSAQEQRYVTKHQGNIAIDTSQPIFDNINSILSHFGGILRYSSGKYHLDVEKPATPILSSDVHNITEDDIIGKINLVDQGIRGAYNSLAVSYADPSNKYEARNISFFNSDYLKADRNVPRKGNLSIPGITNYYNARLLADRYLNKSRFGLEISITIRPKGILLVPGSIIQVEYPKYGWTTPKKFRVETIDIAADCLVDIVATEYDDSFYQISNISKQGGSGLTGLPNVPVINAPSNLSASELVDSDDTTVTINLTWDNSLTASPTGTKTEIYSYSKDILITSISSNVATTDVAHNLSVDTAVVAFITGNGVTAGQLYYVASTPTTTTFTLKTILGSTVTLTNGTGLGISVGKHSLLATLDVPINKYFDVVYSTSSVSKYYRIRHRTITTNINGVSADNYSEFYPNLTSLAILGSTDGAPQTITGQLTNEVVVLSADSAGVVSSYTPASGIFKIYTGITEVTTGVAYSVVSTVSCTGSIDSSGNYAVIVMSAPTAKLNLRAAYGGITIDKTFNVTIVKDGVIGLDGTDAVSVTITNDAYTVFAYAEGTVPSFAGVDGYLKIYLGGTDITSLASLSATASGVTGTINTATGTPVAGFPKGYYRITAMPGDSGTLTLNCVYNSVTYTKVFSVSKVKTGYEIVSALPVTNLFQGRMVFLTTTDGVNAPDKLYRYTGTAWTAAVAATDMTGQLTNAQLADIAAAKITGQLSDSQLASIAAAKIAGQLTNAQLADIAAAKITGQLTNAQVADLAATKITGTITSTQIGTDAVTSPKILAGSIIAGKIAADAVTAGTIAANAVTSGTILAGAVTAGKINTGAVTAGTIAANAVTAGTIEAGAVTAGKINTGAVTAGTIAANAVTSATIEAGAVIAGKINTGAVTAGTIATNAVTAGTIEAGAVTAGKIFTGAVTADKIDAGAITAAKIAAANIAGYHIAAFTIDANNLNTESVTSAKIKAGNIAGYHVAANTIEAANIASNAITTNKISANTVITDHLVDNSISLPVFATANYSYYNMPNTTFIGFSVYPVTSRGIKIDFYSNFHFPSSRTTLLLQLYRDGVPLAGAVARASFDGQDEVPMTITFYDTTAVAGGAYYYSVGKVTGTNIDWLGGSMYGQELKR